MPCRTAALNGAGAPHAARLEQTAGAYIPPRLQRSGAWQAFTLEQSIPIGPGSFLLDADIAERLG